MERDPLDVDYDLRFLSYMLPGLSDDGYRSSKGADGTYGAGSGRAFRYTEEDISRKGEETVFPNSSILFSHRHEASKSSRMFCKVFSL